VNLSDVYLCCVFFFMDFGLMWFGMAGCMLFLGLEYSVI